MAKLFKRLLSSQKNIGMRKSKLLLPINFFHTQPIYKKKRCAQSKITSEKKRDGQKKTCELRSLRRTYNVCHTYDAVSDLMHN